MRWAISVIGVRYLCVMFGGACAGLAGGYLSLVYTPQWVENMTAGRGWIALALVVFASWRPWRAGDRRLSLRRHHHPRLSRCRRMGIGIPSQLLSALPYLVTILVLVVISGNRALMQGQHAGLPRPALRA